MPSSKKIADKFIPKTSSHTNSRISKLIKQLKLKSQKTRIGIKTYRQRYENKLLNKKEELIPKEDLKPIQKISNKKEPSATKLQNTPILQHKTHSYRNKPTTILDHEKIVIPNMRIENEDKHKNDKYIIAIPSYNRADLIQVKTLNLLHKNNINPKVINIFVADRDQYDLYKEKVPSSLYNKLIIGVKGLKNQRNYINNYYREGTHIVEMDDDIEKIVQLVIQKKSKQKSISKNKKHSKKHYKKHYKTHSKKHSKKQINKIIKSVKPIENLDEFIKEAFIKCNANGIFLWGVYPLANPYFMTDTITNDLRFIVGPFWGMINRHREDLQLTVDEKENSERTLQHWVIDGSVLRFNNIGIETKYYKNKGGMQNTSGNRKEDAIKSVQYLHSKYPKITKINLGKKHGMPEIQLKNKVKK